MLARLALALTLVATPFVAAACTGGNSSSGTTSCAQAGRCVNDPPRPSAEVAACQASIDDPACGSLFQSFVNCGAKTQQCSADGMLDAQASLAASVVCHDARVEWTQCQQHALAGDGGQGD